jgi:fructokinase
MERQNQGTVQPTRVAGLGEVLWDLLPGGKQLGGAPSNFAFHVNALGVESVIVSAVGSSLAGFQTGISLSTKHFPQGPSM